MELKILEHFDRLSPLSSNVKSAFTYHAIIRNFHQNEYYLKEWQACKEIAFVEKGALKAEMRSSGRKLLLSYRFINDFDMCVVINSLFSGYPSPESIHAVNDAILVCFKPETLLGIAFKFPAFREILVKYLAKEIIERDSMLMGGRNSNDTPRNTSFRRMYEEYLQQIPDAHLCSLFGVTTDQAKVDD